MAENNFTAREKAMTAVLAIFDRFDRITTHTAFNGFDTKLMSQLTLLSVTVSPKSTVDVSLPITAEYGNLNGVMHGGAAGLIFDNCTMLALGPVSREGHWEFMGGVTRSLNISYLKPIPIGTTVRIHSEVIKIGRTMALISGTITSLDGKTLYCTCEHHKVNMPMREEHKL